MKLVTTDQSGYAAPTAPVPPPEAPEIEHGRDGQHKRTHHRVLLVLALAVFLAAGVGIGLAVGRDDPSPPPTVSTPAAVEGADLAFAQTLRAVGNGAVFHPGTQAPPLGTGVAHFGRQVGIADVGKVNRGRVPGQFPRLLAQAPDLGVFDLCLDRVGIRNRVQFFKK